MPRFISLREAPISSGVRSAPQITHLFCIDYLEAVHTATVRSYAVGTEGVGKYAKLFLLPKVAHAYSLARNTGKTDCIKRYEGVGGMVGKVEDTLTSFIHQWLPQVKG